MNEKFPAEAQKIMNERFGHDVLIALATINNGKPAVRTVNAYYENGCFYVVTYALSGKMQQIAANPEIAVCGDWFTANGVGENIGHVLADSNKELMKKLREVFASWYSCGHVNEADSNTCILRLKLNDGVLMSHGIRYDIVFSEE